MGLQPAGGVRLVRSNGPLCAAAYAMASLTASRLNDRTELVVAVSSTGDFAGRTTVHVDELVDAAWIATPSSNSEPLLGVWPGLPGRPRVVHSARDWLTKLQLVAGGFGVTTVPSGLSPMPLPGVSVLRVDGAPPEIRRVLVARLRGRPTPAITAVTRAITSAT
ncbi:LysR substrate-binding domain-containing protein [Streptomyces platensis]|uniref:LysR substrate-binding domain-containing protein n=1 Tax=Streptomyces platensis TaxID=58346 RepID=UPI003F684396